MAPHGSSRGDCIEGDSMLDGCLELGMASDFLPMVGVGIT